MRFVATLVALGLMSICGKSSAEPKKTPRKNGADSLTESSSSLPSYEKLVAAADANGDGRVSAAELEAFVVRYVKKQVDARFRRLDRNADGRVARAEVPNMVAARFARFDANGDGAFTATELSERMVQEASERCRVVFERLDVDADGEVALADASAARPVRVAGH
jgi:Ca2+-binding EF-hand superfamily protein